MTIVKPRKCSRCSGKGYVEGTMAVHAGFPGGCFKCAGEGVVESDKATIAAAKAYVEDFKSFSQAVMDWDKANRKLADGTRNRDLARAGHMHLETEDPARFALALASFKSGRTDVFPALATYFRSHVCTLPSLALVHF